MVIRNVICKFFFESIIIIAIFTLGYNAHHRVPQFQDVPVLDVHHWQSKDQLGLDESQYEALKIALTKEVAVIQGSPGTGKTFLGLKV
jgi:hypothetical protein